jgi:hypothetical protein
MAVPFLHERYIRYTCLKCGHDAHCNGGCSADPCRCEKCECPDCVEKNSNIEKGQN